MAKLITVFWRDIPSQVMARKRRETRKVLLSPRFQEAIDRAAMRAGKGASDAYMSEWRRETVSCDDADLEQTVQEHAQALESGYSDDDLLALIRARGVSDASHTSG
ncbi:MAG TPA: hypothetical protein DG761_06000 [Gammaproteobacteria bacterium]|jgi:hypothetical protein|nr:hypothetical protein [Acidiferrobacteraceae bacterium]MDP6397666.1 virulence factor [Arenicellales bacterium]HCX87558.1 hypothetical protein [Gammaproteobacteria bacterium]MDP6551445.1 virulence factor [Arenicellales bacterium]MDP6790484.1 virulence factor [Arenicellales bacterium]|tara:strand:- start:457 stop:774 length:318 start_codon:yes stop_codon:yes gene_type:complete